MSFKLVDEIRQFVPKKSATGGLVIPPDSTGFPLCLAVEALGQLAGYVAIENTDFTQLPVAALAGEVLAHRDFEAGQTLDLSIAVRALRPGAMRYEGAARVDGELAVEVRRCTGLLLPLEEFDAPDDVRERFRLLRAGRPTLRCFPERSEFGCQILEIDQSRPGLLEATIQAPERATFYADHFPRRAVYPATLLLDSQILLAQRLLLATAPPSAKPTVIRAVRDIKVRAFTPPGGRLRVVITELEADERASGHPVRLEAFTGDSRVSTATVLLSDS